MKRIRPIEITESVQQLLKRRQHALNADADSLKESAKMSRHSMRQMTLNRALLTESSTSNSITYTSKTGDVASCDQQFARLRRYVNEASQPYKNELCDLLYPIFIHVFLELVINGHRAPAHKFFDRYHDQLVDQTHKERQRVIDTLRHTHMREDVTNNQLLASFREHKYVLFMKSETFDYLMRYLRTQDNDVLMQLFNQYLSVQIKETSNRFETPQEIGQSRTESPEKRRSTDTNIMALQKCINRVRNCPPCVSSICFYTFINTNPGLCTCTISSDQRYLCGGFENSAIKMWALKTPLLERPSTADLVNDLHLGEFRDFDDDTDSGKTSQSEMVIMRGHSGPVYGTAFLPDNKYLLSCSADCTIRLWDLDKFSNVVNYRGHTYPVWNIDVSVLGYFASCSQDKSVRLWSTDRVFPLRTLVGHGMDVECVRFHPNGNYLASGSDDKTIRLWSVQEARTVRLLQAHRSSVFALAFSPNGQLLASSGEDRRIRIWDLSSGNVIKELRGHTDVVYSLAFSQDGAMLASGGMDSTLKVWDVKKTASPSSGNLTDNCSPELLGSFLTKTTSVLYLNYAQYNVLHAAGGALS